MKSLTLLPIKLLKFEGSTEYSVSIHSFLGSVPEKLMPKTISTFRTGYLYSRGTFFHSGHWIFSNKMCKRWPWGWMFIFCLTMEKFITTVWTYVYPCNQKTMVVVKDKDVDRKQEMSIKQVGLIIQMVYNNSLNLYM